MNRPFHSPELLKTLIVTLAIFYGFNVGEILAEDRNHLKCDDLRLFMEKKKAISLLKNDGLKYSTIDARKYYEDPKNNFVPERYLYRFESYPYEIIFTEKAISDQQKIITEIGISQEGTVVSMNCFVRYQL